MTKSELEERIKKLEEALRWYVENDDTNNSEYNEYWWNYKIKAMKLLGMHTDED